MRVTVLSLLALLAAGSLCTDDDADAAPAAYMLVLEHEDKRQCSASLISLRTAVTTASCIRGCSSVVSLWALAARMLAAALPVPVADGARRVVRVAVAGDGRDPEDPTLDFAVVELEAPFGEAAHTRPVMPATEHGCDFGAGECYVQRFIAAGKRQARFIVARMVPAPPGRCAPEVPHWAASQPHLLCFEGDELCERDVGGGVLCAGRLCASVSALAGAHCSSTVAAQQVKLWRQFLLCAHKLHLCGRGACENVCSERYLLEESNLLTSHSRVENYGLNMSTYYATHSFKSLSTTEATAAVLIPLQAGGDETSAMNARHTNMDFEPNRADFKVGPSRTTRVGLKAGEYGDNAAEYGADEPAPVSPPAAPSVPARTSPPSTAAAPTERATPPAPALRSSVTSSVILLRTSLTVYITCFLISFAI